MSKTALTPSTLTATQLAVVELEAQIEYSELRYRDRVKDLMASSRENKKAADTLLARAVATDGKIHRLAIAHITSIERLKARHAKLLARLAVHA